MHKKILKVFVSIVIAILIALVASQNVVFAEITKTITIKLSKERYVKNSNGEYQKKNEYILKTGSDHSLFQIASYNSNNEILETNFYCLDATAGYSWVQGTAGQGATYNRAFDLVEEKELILALYEAYKGILNEKIYTQVMWVLDNMYTEDGETVEGLLNKAGIVYGKHPDYSIEMWRYNSTTMVWPLGYSGYRCSYNGTVYDVVLSEEEVEAIQQAVIWYFTNYIAKGETEYNCYTSDIGSSGTNGNWFEYTETTTGNDEKDALIKSMKQEQAAILCNYLIEGANAAVQNGYDTSKEANLSLDYVSESQKITIDGIYYVLGPMVATTTGNIQDLQLEVKTGTNYETTIATEDVTLKDEDGNTILEMTAGEPFTVIVPRSSVDESIKVTVSGKAITTTKLLWISDSANAEQPLAQPIKNTTDVDDYLVAAPIRLFDLALRKQIVAVNGKSTETDIINENGLDARRIMNITDTIPDTATYKHRKDPVVVNEEDIVTYRINIYNEGEVNGYASKIIDQLADNLVINPNMGATVTSAKGNVYNVDSTTPNQIILEIDTTKEITSLVSYGGDEIDVDYIDITCQVKQIAETDGETKHYLTNIAYIAEEYRTDGETPVEVTQDRISESKPNNTDVTNGSNGLNVTNSSDVYHGSTNSSIFNTGTNNDFYFAGQEDDDDFETVVVLPIRFDLALRKFITAVSVDGNFENSSTTTTYSRVPQVDTTELGTTDLNGDIITTAEYNHSKEPISVDVGNYILYTIRVYNEGSVRARAAEITDYLPRYLDFIDTTTNTYINNINSKWEYEATTRKLTTTALAETTLAPFDTENDDGAGLGLAYADVQVVCKVNTETLAATKLTNIAEISQYADKDGNIVDDGTNPNDEGIDIDSDANDFDYPDDVSIYKDEEIANGDKYIPGQEDDDDFEKVTVRTLGKYDLVLIKQDENGEQLNSVATFKVAQGTDIASGKEEQVTGQLVIADDVEISSSNVSIPDVYTIQETVAPDGYCEFDGIITVTVSKTLNGTGTGYEVSSVNYAVTDSNGNELETEDANVYLENGNIYVEVKNYEIVRNLRITKVAEEDHSITLSGTEFALYKFIGEDSDNELIDINNVNTANWTLVDTYISSSTGIIELKDLPITSKYRLIETKASEERIIAEGQWEIEFMHGDYDTSDTSIVIINEVPIKITAIGNPPAFITTDEGELLLPNRKYYKFPTSGSFGIKSFYKIGTIVGGIGLLILFLRKRVYIVRK